MLKNKIFVGAFYLSGAMLLAKVIGALYRIPLTVIVGSKYLGIYQMVFPLYTMLLTLSSSGIPMGISKIISNGKNAESILKKSLTGFLLLGFIGVVFMVLLSGFFAKIQNTGDVVLCYITLAPSVFFVSLISCFRGYFQGKNNMLPTAISNVSEQIIKLIFGLGLVLIFGKIVKNLAVLLTVAVTISEIVTCVILLIIFKKQKGKSEISGDKISFLEIFFEILPLMLTGIILPFSRMFESFVILRWQSVEPGVALSQYGLYSGAVESIINVPVALVSSIAISALPNLTKQGEKVRGLIFVTFLVSACFTLLIALYSDFLCKILYRRLTIDEQNTIKTLLKMSSVQVLFLSLISIESAVLTSKSRQKALPVNLSIGVAVKIISMRRLILGASFGIYGLVISDILCYFVACSLDLLYIIGIKQNLSGVVNGHVVDNYRFGR